MLENFKTWRTPFNKSQKADKQMKQPYDKLHRQISYNQNQIYKSQKQCKTKAKWDMINIKWEVT